MFAKIAVPLDGSPLAEKALPYALRLAKAFYAELLLLRVADLPALVSDTADHELAVIREAEDYLQNIKAVVTDQALEASVLPEQVQTLVAYGERAREIAEIAPFEGADLIVMTTHARTGLPRLVLGSVAIKILQKSNVPVLLINPEKTIQNETLIEALTENLHFEVGGKVGSVVVTLDGSVESEAILAPAVETARRLNAPLYLLEVVIPYVPIEYGELGVGYRYDPDQETLKRAEEAGVYLDNLVAKIVAQGVTCEKVVKIGSAAIEITNFAKEVDATLLAMATHARGVMGQFFMGSVAEDVVRRTHLPVLMVHTAPKQVTVEGDKEVVTMR